MWVVYDTEIKCRCGKATNNKEEAERNKELANEIHNTDRYIVIKVDF